MRFVKVIKERYKSVPFPFAGGISLANVLSFFFKEVLDQRFTVRAAAMAYNFFFSLFPAIIFLLTLIPYIPVDNLEQEFLSLLKQSMPASGFELIQSTVHGVFAYKTGSVLSLSLILTIYSASNGLVVMINTFDKTGDERFFDRSGLKDRLISMGFVPILVIFLVIIIVLMIGIEFLINYLQTYDLANYFLHPVFIRFINLLFTWVFLTFGLSLLYTFLPARIKRPAFFSVGAFISALLIVLATFAFSYFINNLSNYNKVYGSLSTIIILLFLFYWLSIIILIGYELNLAIESAVKTENSKLKKQ